MPAYETIIRD